MQTLSSSRVGFGRRPLILSTAFCKQSRLLAQSNDPARSAFDRFPISSPGNAVIPGKGDQLLNVAIGVVPLLFDEARRIAANIAKLPTLLGKGGWDTGTPGAKTNTL